MVYCTKEVVMLEVNGLTKKYNKVLAADNVSFTIMDGQIGVIMGPMVLVSPPPSSPLQDFCAILEK